MAKVIRKEGPGAARLKAILRNLREATVKVGFFEDAQYEDGTPIASVALWIEFGTVNSPPRPIFRITVTENLEEWRNLVKLLAKRIVDGNLTVLQVMEQLGAAATGHLSKTIAELTEPPLAESTIENRLRRRADQSVVGGLDKPLIDSGLFFASPTWQAQAGGKR